MCSLRSFPALLALVLSVVSLGCAGSTVRAVQAPDAEMIVPRKTADRSEERIEEREYANRIKWKTASEVDNFGYDVYRGESPDGPFERLNSEVIEGAGTTDEVTAYEYADRTIDPRVEYYYYVESISMNGDRVRFTPLGRARAKIGAEGLEGGDDSALEPAGTPGGARYRP